MLSLSCIRVFKRWHCISLTCLGGHFSPCHCSEPNRNEEEKVVDTVMHRINFCTPSSSVIVNIHLQPWSNGQSRTMQAVLDWY